jgi:hypothetical protein
MGIKLISMQRLAARAIRVREGTYEKDKRVFVDGKIIF